MAINQPDLFGQWIGTIEGTNAGSLIINIEDRHIDEDKPGVAVVQVDDGAVPFIASLLFAATDHAFSGDLAGFVHDSGPQIANTNITLPSTGYAEGTVEGDRITGSWKTDANTQGSFEVTRKEPSVARPAPVLGWAEFREWAFKEAREHNKLIFRGHTNSTETLLTTFHRKGRRNLVRYSNEDVPRLRRAVEPVIGMSYDLRDPFEYGALLNLGQHHGFPTPLLDWTESPFVAAYFALSRHDKKARDERVRIFVLDLEHWPPERIRGIAHSRPAFARMELLARDNPRVNPQQSVHMFSNVVDIETFVEDIERQKERTFLRRIDIPLYERNVAMRDLGIMGVTAAALYPGVEGVCQALTEKWF